MGKENIRHFSAEPCGRSALTCQLPMYLDGVRPIAPVNQQTACNLHSRNLGGRRRCNCSPALHGGNSKEGTAAILLLISDSLDIRLLS